MRPRVFPAEDPFGLLTDGIPEAGASMRPRVFPAEDRCRHRTRSPGRRASMRPRVFPAEDAPGRRDRRPSSRCFNEAAGIPRGRR